MINIMEQIANRKIEMVYQPIVRNEEIVGHEALVRGSNDESPALLFYEAERCGLTRNLDMLCVYTSLENAPDTPLFINILPHTLIWLIMSGKIDRVLAKQKNEIIFELIEVEKMSIDLTSLYEAVSEIKKYGIKVAIDDISQGFNRLQLISEIKPDYIKLDRYLTMHLSKEHGLITKSLVDIASNLNIDVIAEAIETKDEYKNMLGFGVEYFQGYFFSKPIKAPVLA